MTGPRPLALVVDDEAPLAALVGSYLEREGFDVELTGNGETAVQLARQRRPDVLGARFVVALPASRRRP